MRLDRAYALSSRLVALSGLAAFLITGEAPLWLVLPAMAAALLGVLPRNPATGLVMPKGAVPFALATALIFSVFDFLFIGGSLIMAAADLLVILLAVKLFSLSQGRDYVQLYAVSFFLLLASTGIATEVYFFAVFIMFFVSLTWSLILMNIKGGAADGARARDIGIGRGFFIGTAALTVGATVFTLAIFLIIPRVGMGFFSRRAGGLLKVSGFSDNVTFGSIGEVKLDPTVVMRVELPGVHVRPRAELYWRGRAYDYYNDKSWEATSTLRQELYRTYGGVFYVRPGERIPADAVVQDISLEPLETTTIFAPYPAYVITSDFRALRIDDSGGLQLMFPPEGRLHYTVTAAPGIPVRDTFIRPGHGGRPAQPNPAYLQLPGGSGDLVKLAGDVTKGAASDTEKASRIIGYLDGNLRYSLNPPRDHRYTPINDFLFHSRAGYCEQFATAMVLMLRATGVPARLVSGFMGGEWNDYGGYFLVREQDAHTWVEAFVPGKGWVTFDPTPATPQKEAAALGRFTTFLDFLRYRWDRYIVFYNVHDQLVAAHGVSELIQNVRQRAEGFAEALLTGSLRSPAGRGKGTLFAVIIIIPAALTVAVYFLRRRVRVSKFKRGRVVFYEEMTRLLRKKGLKRPPGKTPREFAADIEAQRGASYKGVFYVTELYNRVRFGGSVPGREEEARIRDIITHLKEL